MAAGCRFGQHQGIRAFCRREWRPNGPALMPVSIPATAHMFLVEVSEGKRASNKKWDFFNK